MLPPVSSPAERLATWRDIAHLPEGTRVEVLDGQIVFAPSPTPAHQRIGGGLSRRIGGPFDEDGDPGGWWILQEVDVELGRHRLVQPDVAGWRRERVPGFPSDRPIRIVPDWVCEILSPSNSSQDRVRKANLYLDAGVPYYWIADPMERVLEAFAAEGGRWVRLGAYTDGDRARIAPFEAVELDVGRLFPPLPASGAAERGGPDQEPG